MKLPFRRTEICDYNRSFMQNNLYVPPNQTAPTRKRYHAACVTTEDVATLLGLPKYTIPQLVRAKLLKPLGKPSQNARKWFARVEIEALAQDRAWLDKSVLILERYFREMNLKQRSRNLAAKTVVATSENTTEA